MPKIDPAVIEGIRENSDIVTVIGHYLPLVQKGKSIKCICPFHDDHDPSLSISKEKQIYKCFVCNSAGNVFTFVQNYEQITYLQAVKKVAEIGNLTFDYQVNKTEVVYDKQTQRYYDLMKESNDYMMYQLKLADNKRFLTYLKSRDLTEELINKFQIGYVPKGNKMLDFLIAKGYKETELKTVNLSGEDNRGSYSVFNNRITFPILNEMKQIVGFCARSLDDNQVKYINSASTTIYQKSHILYNYASAKDHCRKSKKVLVCEGVMDVIAFTKVGINNVVSTLGTACTIDQLKMLKRLANEICICYDGDSAGLLASYKLGQLASDRGIPVMIWDNKTGLDPDEIIKKYSAKELELLSEKPLNWIEFLMKYLKRKYDLENFSQKDKYAREVLIEINKLTNKQHQQYFLKQLNETTSFNMAISEKKKITIAKKEIPAVSPLLAQKEIVNQMLHAKEAIVIFQDQLGYLPDTNLNRLAMLVIKAFSQNLLINSAMLYSMIPDESLIKLLGEIVGSDVFEKTYNREVLLDAVITVKRLQVVEQIKDLNIRIKATLDPVLKEKLEREKITLKAEELDYLPMKEEKPWKN